MATLLTIIVNWRTPEMTLRSASAAMAAMDGIDGAISIVDNLSADGSEEVLRAAVAARGWTGRVQVLQAGHNGGFGAGNNVAIRAGLPSGARPDYVYLLNSDAFPASEAIRPLLDCLESDPKLGFAGSYTHGLDGTPHTTLFRFPSVWSELETAARTGPITRLLAGHVVPLPIPAQGIVQADWLAGASVMMRREMLDVAGLFDETYFLYFEETDLFLRAARTGWGAAYVRASHVAHIGSESTGMKRWGKVPGYWFDSRWRYFAKNHGRAVAAAATLAHLAGGSLCALRCAFGGRPRETPEGMLRAMLGHLLRNAFQPVPPDPSPMPLPDAAALRSQRAGGLTRSLP